MKEISKMDKKYVDIYYINRRSSVLIYNILFSLSINYKYTNNCRKKVNIIYNYLQCSTQKKCTEELKLSNTLY
jgi:hypothetical protein